jgi:hypothetical protein
MGAGHLDQRADLDTFSVHRADEVGDATVFGIAAVGVTRGFDRRPGAGDQDAPTGMVGQAGPHLLTIHHPLVAVTLGHGADRRQIRSCTRLGEQLTPQVLSGHEPVEPPLLLLLGAGLDQGRPGPTQPDGVGGTPHPG